MIKNKQINVWRGDDHPPTIYHLWILEDLKIRLHNGIEWVEFITNASIGQDLVEIIASIESLESFMNNSTVNGEPIKNNPILDAEHFNTTIKDGVYIKENDNVAQALKKHDELLRTKYIE